MDCTNHEFDPLGAGESMKFGNQTPNTNSVTIKLGSGFEVSGISMPPGSKIEIIGNGDKISIDVFVNEKQGPRSVD